MAFGQSPTTTTEGALPSNQIFISSVATPNTANGDLTALEGGPISTDSNSNKTAPASMYIKDGNDVTQGTSTDANTVNSIMGRLTKIRDLLNATLTIAGNVTEANSAAIKADLDAILVDTADIETNTANIPPLGQALAAASVPVVLTAAQQTALTPPAAITNFALESGGNLASILAALDDGQETMANSLSVAIASDQSAVPVSAASLPLPTGAALEAGHLATIDSHTPALGQAAMASSVPVTLASNQSNVPVSVQNVNANGQSTMANSAPVVLPSDQPGLSQMAKADGLIPSNVLAAAIYLLSAGGPPDSTGKPQSAALDRLASWQGKGVGGSNNNITSTLAGDNSLAFASAPKTIMPGAKIQLSVGSGAAVETVIVSSSYTPSSTATSIPLQYPVVNANSTTAKWDIHNQIGPATSNMLPTDLLPVMLAAYDPNAALPITLETSALDARSTNLALMVNAATYNGSTMDRARGNLDNISLIASAAYTTTQTGADQTNYNGKGVIVVLNMSNAGTGSVTLEIDGKDPVSGQYYALLTGAAVTTNSVNVYTVYPGTTVAANVSASTPLPRTWRIKVTANNANSATYSVGASVIV